MKITTIRSVPHTYDHQSWRQRAHITFLHLHLQIGARNSKDTTAITRANEHTQLGWLSQSSMIEGWVNICGFTDSRISLSALPENFRMLIQTPQFASGSKGTKLRTIVIKIIEAGCRGLTSFSCICLHR